MSNGKLGDVYRLPFADGSFDIVSCRFAFHHLEEPAKSVRRDGAGLPFQWARGPVRCRGFVRSGQGNGVQCNGTPP